MSTKWLVFGTPLWFGLGKCSHVAYADKQPTHTTVTSDGKTAASPAELLSDQSRKDVSTRTDRG